MQRKSDLTPFVARLLPDPDRLRRPAERLVESKVARVRTKLTVQLSGARVEPNSALIPGRWFDVASVRRVPPHATMIS